METFIATIRPLNECPGPETIKGGEVRQPSFSPKPSGLASGWPLRVVGRAW